MRISFYHMNGGVVWKRISGAARGEIKRRNSFFNNTLVWNHGNADFKKIPLKSLGNSAKRDLFVLLLNVL